MDARIQGFYHIAPGGLFPWLGKNKSRHSFCAGICFCMASNGTAFGMIWLIIDPPAHNTSREHANKLLVKARL